MSDGRGSEAAPVVAVLSTGRQDYGILRSLILALDADPRFELDLWLGGMHLVERFGDGAEAVREDGVDRFRRLDFLAEPPEPSADAARAMAGAVALLRERRPGMLLLVGDRSETAAVALAAAVEGVPLVHIHGGEETEGAVDNALRHAITKLAHLHFTTHSLHRRRVIQMGEPPGTVHLVAPPGLDNLYRDDLPDRRELLASLGLVPVEADARLDAPLIAVTVHPTTLGTGDVLAESRAVAASLEERRALVVLTLPNADAGGASIRDFWRAWVRDRPGAVAVAGLGARRYWGLLLAADAVVGNSSSGLIEAPAAGVPVVNVGDRQRGRLRHPMTLDVPAAPQWVSEALDRALDPAFRARFEASESPYPSGPAAPEILRVLASWTPPKPPRKPFRLLAAPEAGTEG